MSFAVYGRPRGEHTETKVYPCTGGSWRTGGGSFIAINATADGSVSTAQHWDAVREKSASYRSTTFQLGAARRINALLVTLDGSGVASQSLMGVPLSTLYVAGGGKQTVLIPFTERVVSSLLFGVSSGIEFNWYRVQALWISGARK